jgi:hypothetical protein
MGWISPDGQEEPKKYYPELPPAEFGPASGFPASQCVNSGFAKLRDNAV